MHVLAWRIGRRRLGRKPSIRKTGHGPFPSSPQRRRPSILSGKKNRLHLVRFAPSSTFRCWFRRKECEQTAAEWRQRRGHPMVGASTLPFKALLPSPHLGAIYPYGFPIPARNFDSVLVVVATLLARLRDGTAKFELLDDSALAHAPPAWPRLHCFARVASSLRGGWSAALNKVEHYGVQRVTGDGRCMFRALAKGMAKNKGIPLAPREEVQDADDLRMAVKEIICDRETERQEYEEAVIAITMEQSLKRYCQRIRRPDFWGGESELLVLSRLCRQPIIIYIPEREYHGRGNGFIPIAEYGLEFTKNTKQWKKKTPVRLLYSGRNHYDLLV